MRILLITNRYPVDRGDPASPFVPHFAQALVDCGTAVDVLTPDYEHARPPAASGDGKNHAMPLSVERFETSAGEPIGSWNFAAPSSWFKLRAFLRNGVDAGRRLCNMHRYDYILALWALPSGHIARQLSKEFGIPYAVWCLGSDIYVWAQRPVIRQYIARILRGAQHVFADGDDLCQRIHRWLGLDVTFLPSLRPLDGLANCHVPDPTDAPGYLCLGRLHQAKGIFELLDAFYHLRQTLPDARLCYVGSGPAADELRNRIHVLGLEDQVILTGAVQDTEVVRRLLESHVVVIPTRSDSIPLVLTEAVQAMRPVVGTDTGDVGACIRRYRVGLVTPSLQPPDLAATMIEAARHPSLSLEGREALLNEFDPQAAARTFCDIALQARGVNQTPENSPTPRQQAAYSS